MGKPWENQGKCTVNTPIVGGRPPLKQLQMIPSGYDKQFAMENPTIFENGKPSISMGHLYHGEL